MANIYCMRILQCNTARSASEGQRCSTEGDLYVEEATVSDREGRRYNLNAPALFPA
jgi:hypothetical protein